MRRRAVDQQRGLEKAEASPAADPPGLFGFGPFTFDPSTLELFRHDRLVPLARQPSLLLRLLLARRNQLVRREEIAEMLWPDGRFVDSETGINNAVRRLRRALGDSSGEPLFVQTLTGLGYRFIHAVERLPAPGRALARTPDRRSHERRRDHRTRARLLVATIAVLLFALVSFFLRQGRLPWKSPVESGGIAGVADPEKARAQRLALSNSVPERAAREYLEATFLLRQEPAPSRDPRSHLESVIELLESCLAKAPRFADAWVALARAHVRSGDFEPLPTWSRPALLAASRAVELEPEHVGGLAELAMLRLEAEYDWESSNELSRRALALDPDNAAALHARAKVLAAAGRIDQAVALIERSRRLEPTDRLYVVDASYFYFLAQRYAEASELFDLLAETRPGDLYPTFMKIRVAEALGDREEALALAGKLTERWTGLVFDVHSLEAFWRGTAQSSAPGYLRAVALMHLGQDDEALKILVDVCRQQTSVLVVYSAVDPDLQRLREHPSLGDLAECLGWPLEPWGDGPPDQSDSLSTGAGQIETVDR